MLPQQRLELHGARARRVVARKLPRRHGIPCEYVNLTWFIVVIEKVNRREETHEVEYSLGFPGGGHAYLRVAVGRESQQVFRATGSR